MIKVIVELHPFGISENKKVIGEAKIWNDGSGDHTSGNYKFEIYRKGSKKVWKEGEVKNFPRTKLNVWHLMYRCFMSVLSIGKK